jgi:tRNA threonylcarbamoyladenosine biosynthesis protein TsaB
VSVIAIDSASRDRALALLVTDDGALIEQREMPGGELDRRLPGVLAQLGDGEVTAVVVLTGPGSYSGVRAGMAAALGFAAARVVPLHGLGNLAAIAMAANVADDAEFTVVADAGRGGVYVARFRGGGGLVEQVSPIRRVTAGLVDTGARVFAAAEISGLPTAVLEPTRVLAAAVPRALALPPLDALGLTAIHADPAATTTGMKAEEVPGAL